MGTPRRCTTGMHPRIDGKRFQDHVTASRASNQRRPAKVQGKQPMRRFNPVLIILILFAAGFIGASLIALRPQGAQTEGKPLIGGPFSLLDTEGKRVTDRDFRGKLMLVFFGYTHCPDVCPTELQTMSEVIDKLGTEADKVAPIFISVDPQRDTPETLASYVKNFSSRIVGLTGDLNDVASAAKAYRVYFRKAGSGADDYTVDHSAFVYLMDQEGKYLTHFAFNAPPDTIMSAIRKQIIADKSA
jgi:protein SCO1